MHRCHVVAQPECLVAVCEEFITGIEGPEMACIAVYAVYAVDLERSSPKGFRFHFHHANLKRIVMTIHGL